MNLGGSCQVIMILLKETSDYDMKVVGFGPFG